VFHSDGVSAGILMTELAAAYNAIKAGRAEPDLAALPIQYADFSAWQRARLDGGELEAQRAHWRQQLADAPLLLQLPTDFARPAEPSGRAGDVGLEVAAEATAGLRALAAGCGATMFTVLLAAWQVRGPRPCPPGRAPARPAAPRPVQRRA
jgi:arthrofactin-type cyclic lipopeptide synthetase C